MPGHFFYNFFMLFCVTEAATRQLTFQYLGCFIESVPADRDLVGLKGLTQLGPYPVSISNEGLTSIAGMTINMCSQLCSLGGFPYFGAQFGSVCSCDFTYGSFGPASEADCSINCAGNASQKCGNAYRNSMYQVTYADNSVYRLVKAGSEPQVLVSTGYTMAIVNMTASISSDMECISQCQRSLRCQAVFYIPGYFCYLLPFAAIPVSLVGTQGQMWTRI